MPNSISIGLLGLTMLAGGLSLHRRRRTDADRLSDLDKAESDYVAKITSPAYIAAQEKRARKRNKLLSLS